MKTILSILAFLFSLCSYSQNWVQKASLPSNVGTGGPASFSINGKLYVGGGYSTLSGGQVTTFYEYDPVIDTWTQKANIPAALNNSHCFVLNGKGYMCCGAHGPLVNTVYSYDPVLDTWQTLSNFPGPARQNGGGFSLNGKGYICGGFIGGNSSANDMWQYNDTLDTWTQMANIPGPGRDNGPYPFIINGQVYLGLGANWNGTVPYSDMYRFNPDSNIYTSIGNFPTPLFAYMSFSIGQTGYIGLGNTGASTPNLIYKYDPTNDSWTIADTFGGGNRYSLFSQVVAGKPYIGCGVDSAGTLFYDNWTWECTAPTISQHDDTLFSSLTGGCQWYLNDSLITGATSPYYIATSAGSYTVQASDSNSCSSSSTAYSFKPSSVVGISDMSQVNIFPNPTSGTFVLQANSYLIGTAYYLTDIAGRNISSGTINNEITRFDVGELSSGLYILQVGNRSYKLIKN